MQLEEYLEKDIVTFLEQRIAKKKELSNDSEEDYGLFLTKDYLKEIGILLDKDEVTESEKLFDELKEHYNSLPKESLEARKVYSILEMMYSKINTYLKLKGAKGVRSLHEILASHQPFSDVAYSTGPVQVSGVIERKLENIDTKISRFGEDVNELKKNLISKRMTEIQIPPKISIGGGSMDSEGGDTRAPVVNVIIPAINKPVDIPVFEPKPEPKPEIKPEPKPAPPIQIKPAPRPVPKPVPVAKPSVIPVIVSKTLVEPTQKTVEKEPITDIEINTKVDGFHDESIDDLGILPKTGRKSKMILIPKKVIAQPDVPDQKIPDRKSTDKRAEKRITDKLQMTQQEMPNFPAPANTSESSRKTKKPLLYIPDSNDAEGFFTDKGTSGFDAGMMHNQQNAAVEKMKHDNPIVPMKDISTSDTNESLYNEGLKLMYEGQYGEASRVFTRLLDKDPKNKKAAIRLQQCLGGT